MFNPRITREVRADISRILHVPFSEAAEKQDKKLEKVGKLAIYVHHPRK
jgi:hypothetical protein